MGRKEKKQKMGKRKGKKETQGTFTSTDENGGNGNEELREEEKEDGGKGGGRFFACYLLTSLCPRFKGHTYIGFTVNPRRRIRQHNGEIGSGAWRTKRKRPWEMVLCIYGFPTNVSALQFEWAWQHPVESLAVRKAAASFKSLSGLANKIKLAHTMLTLPSWQSLNLTVNFFSTKYQQHISGCPTLPEQMRTQVCSMDDLPCYNGNAPANDECDWDEDCDINGNLHEPNKENSVESPGNHYTLPLEGNGHTIFNQENRTNHESSGFCIGRPRSFLPAREETQLQHFIINDISDETSSSFGVSYNVENVHLSAFVEDFSTKLDKPLTASSAVDKDQISIQSPNTDRCDVEIIDLFTPSPRNTVKSGSKKRRPTMYPEIIDLTEHQCLYKFLQSVNHYANQKIKCFLSISVL